MDIVSETQSARAIDLLDREALVRGGQGVFGAIYGRRAIRVYSGEAVSRTQVDALIDVAIHAPSALNAQPWAFVVVQEADLLDRYADEAKALLLAEPAPPEVENSGLPELDRLRQMVSEPGYALFHGASTLIVIYATNASGVPDCFLAAQNLMLGAWALGLGTCPIGLATPLFNCGYIKKELGIPSNRLAALPIVVGHPAGTVPPTARRPAVVTWR
jgi:nitroreductase